MLLSGSDLCSLPTTLKHHAGGHANFFKHELFQASSQVLEGNRA